MKPTNLAGRPHRAPWRRLLMCACGPILGLAGAGASVQAAQPATPVIPATAASAPARVSPHAVAALQRAKAASEPQRQGGFSLMAHGRPHRPGSRTGAP